MTDDDAVIAPLDALTRRAEDDGAAAVVEELERAATAVNTRVAPLVPGCGFLVTVAGLLLKAEPTSERVSEVLISLSVVLAVGAIGFLAHGLFTYAGRRSIGLVPTAQDIPYARERLVRKHRSAGWGGWLAGLALAGLVAGILLGVSF